MRSIDGQRGYPFVVVIFLFFYKDAISTFLRFAMEYTQGSIN